MLHLTPAPTAASSLHRATGHKNMQMENCELRASDTREVHRSGGLQQSAVTMRCRVWLTAALQHRALQRCSGIYKFIFAQFLRCACLIRSITAAYPPSPARQARPGAAGAKMVPRSVFIWMNNWGGERQGGRGGTAALPGSRLSTASCKMMQTIMNCTFLAAGGLGAGCKKCIF